MPNLKSKVQRANARFVSGRGGAQLTRIERGPVRSAVLAALPMLMPRLFRKEATRALCSDRLGGEPLTGTLELNLSKPGTTTVDTFVVAFDGDGCTVRRGSNGHRPDAGVTIGLPDLVRLGSGAYDPGTFLAEGIAAGRIELNGDPFLMLAFPNLFGLANRKII